MKLKIYSPYDRKIIGEVKLNTWPQIDKMLTNAQSLFNNREGWLSKKNRLKILNKFGALLEKEKESRARQISLEGGKPLIDARIEAGRAVEGVRIAIAQLELEIIEEIPMNISPASMNRRATATREPIGVVVALSAFNHPLNLIIHQVIPAIAVGCPVIVKPASSTPFSCIRVVELLKKAGLPDGWCQMVICDNKNSEKLATDPRVNFLSFIGSARVGWHLRSKLAPGTRYALEHGGVAPVIVEKDADIEKAIPLLVKGAFYHAGQVCVSVKRIFAHESIAKKVAAKLADAAEKMTVGDPLSESTAIGPLINPAEVDRVAAWVDEAIKDGAKCLCGGKNLSRTTYAPTVLFNPPETAKVSTQETFGPVVCVYSYKNIKEAIARANSLLYAFQASVFTRNKKTANDIAEKLDATAVMINDHTAFRVDWMPFGGRRQSGLGLGGIGYTMHDMTQLKMVVVNEN